MHQDAGLVGKQPTKETNLVQLLQTKRAALRAQGQAHAVLVHVDGVTGDQGPQQHLQLQMMI
jgi:hypothetical protein